MAIKKFPSEFTEKPSLDGTEQLMLDDGKKTLFSTVLTRMQAAFEDIFVDKTSDETIAGNKTLSWDSTLETLRITKSKNLTATTDLNTVVSGWFYDVQNAGNKPVWSTSRWYLIVQRFNTNDKYVYQEYIDMTKTSESGIRYWRTMYNGVWKNWKTIWEDTAITAHLADTSNPHSVTKTQLWLWNVTNTSDSNKPVSTAQQAALDLKANDNAVVHKTGDESIAGDKSFSDELKSKYFTYEYSTNLANWTDLDTLIVSWFYDCSNATNRPSWSASRWYLIVQRHSATSHSSYIYQEYTELTRAAETWKKWRRTKYNGVWKARKRVAEDGNVVHKSWTEAITGTKDFKGNVYIKWWSSATAGDSHLPFSNGKNYIRWDLIVADTGWSVWIGGTPQRKLQVSDVTTAIFNIKATWSSPYSSRIEFWDDADFDIGYMEYLHWDNSFKWTWNATANIMKLSSTWYLTTADRARIDDLIVWEMWYWVNYHWFRHSNMTGTWDYAIMQNQLWETLVNSKTWRALALRQNNSTKFQINTDWTLSASTTINDVDLDDTGRISPTLLNSRVNFWWAYATCQYRKINGVVYVKWVIKDGTTSIGTTIFTLPSWYRPSATELISIHIEWVDGGYQVTSWWSVQIYWQVNPGKASIKFSFPV